MKAAVIACVAALVTQLTALTTFPPTALAADDHIHVVPIEVQSTGTAPPSITFRIHKTTYDLDVYRKLPDATAWGAKIATIPAASATWTDSSVAIGSAYEYRFHATGVPAATDSTHVRSYVLAGVEVDRSGPRGRVVLVMPASIQAPLAAEIARFKRDLVGDGWTVHDVLTPDGRTDWTCAADGHHVQIRDDIRAIHNAHPGEVKHVILLGRVPQPRSGLRAAWAPDGHGDLGATAADAYYADVDNTWTDTGTITVAYANEAGSVRPAWFNNPGDGRFDQSHFRSLAEAFEMGWGRIDFRGSVNGGDEIGALRNYLNKLHDYKHAQNGFKPGRRSVVRDSGSLYKHVQEEFWKTITPLCGMENLDYITGSNLPVVAWQPEAQYTFDNGPYLYFFMAGNEPNLPSDMSRAVFWTGFKSHVGYWDLNSWTRSRLAEPNSWTLSWTFAPPRGRYVYHKMGLGGTIGDMMRATINNQDNESGLYGSAVKNFINGAWTVQNPASGPGDYAGFLFHGHMGDPTLRDQMIESPAWVRGRLQNGGAEVAVEWQASPDASHGYDIYSSASAFGPFTKRNGGPLHIGVTSGELSWTDSTPPSDPVHYMVRALKMETTAGGSYLNASTGRIAEVDRTPDAFTIVTSTLPDAYLGSAYNHHLQTSGGNPPATWMLTSGSLPAGLSLSMDGSITGTPNNAGSFPVSLQATDLPGATQTTSLTLQVDMFSDWSLLPNGDLAAPPHNTSTVNQSFSGNWQFPAAPNTQWDYDAANGWVSTSVDGRTGAQPGIVYVVSDNQARSGAVSFRFDMANTDGSGTPNLIYLRIYGINGNFSWDHWNLGSNPTGDATLLHIREISGNFGWTTFETPALPVGAGFQYYVIRFYPANVTAAEGDFMALDKLRWSNAAPPPALHNVTFSAGPNGSLTGEVEQTIASGGSTSAVTAVPASGYELANWTWTGGGSSTENPLVISGVSADLTVSADFQLFNQPPASVITFPLNNSTYLQGTFVPFGGSGYDPEDGTITAATWTSSIDGVFTPVGGIFAGLSPGTHTITRTVTDSGGKTGAAGVSLTITPSGIFAQDFSASSVVADYIGSNAHLFDFLGTDTSGNNRGSLSITGGRLRNTIAYTNDGNSAQLSAVRLTRRTDLPVEDNFAVVSAKAYLSPQNWPSGDTTYLGFTIGENFRTGIFNPASGTGNGPAFASLNLQARSTPDTFRTTGVGGNSPNFTATSSGGVYSFDLVFAANAGTTEQTFPAPTGDHTLQPGRVSVWINGALHINNTNTGITAANLVDFSFSTGSGTAQGYSTGSVFDGYYEIDDVLVRTISNFENPPPPEFVVNFIAGAGGSITGGQTQTVVMGGETTAVTAVPDANYQFVNWTWFGGSSTDNPLVITGVVADLTVTANFTEVIPPVPADPAQPENPGGGTGLTYYLDAANGNDASDGLATGSAWQSFQKAVNTLQPGDTVLIREGDYHSTGNDEYKNWDITTSGAPGQYITFCAYPGERPRFHVDTWNGIQLWNVSHIELDGLEIVGLPDPVWLADEPENSAARQALAQDRQYFGGGITVTHNGSEPHHIRIRNCVVRQVGGNGIGIRGGNLHLLENNTVHHSTHRSDAGNSAISFVELNAAQYQSAGYGVVARNNRLHHNRNMVAFKYAGYITDGNGIIIDYCQDYTGDRILIANNLAWNNGGRAVHIYNGRNVDVIHNTAWHNLASADMQWAGELSSDAPGGSNNDFIIFHNNIADARADRRAYQIANTNNWTFTRNLVRSQKAPAHAVDPATNLIDADPRFVNTITYDFRLLPDSLALDAGLVFASIPNDADGNVRNQGAAPDLGAHEGAGSAPPVSLPDGYYNAALHPGVDASGINDSTTGLQEAIDHCRDNQLVLWLPAGTYRVSDRLVIDQPDNQSGFPVVIRGSTLDPAQRAKILLAPNSPGFNDPNNRRVMIHYINIGTPETESGNTDLYDQGIIGVDLVIGASNDGAVALRMQGAEGCTIEDVNIDLTQGGHTGIWGIPASGGSTHRATITGGVIGIDTIRPNGGGGGSQPQPTVTGSTFINQSGVAVRGNTRGALVMVGCRFERSTPGAFFELRRHWQEQPLDGSLQLIDSELRYAAPNPANTVIVMGSSPGRSFHFDNVFIRHAPHVWTTNAPATADGWHHFTRLAVEVLPSARDWGQMREQVWRDGAVVGDILVEGVSGVAPPADLQSRHQWAVDFPTWETPGAVNIADLGAVGDDVTDNWAVIQDAINEHEIVFIPKGSFAVSQTLNLRPESKLIGAYPAFSSIRAISTLSNRFGGTVPEGPDAPIIRSADSATAETWLAHFQIARTYPLASHNPATPGNHALEWRSGGNSVLRHVKTESRIAGGFNLRPDFIARLFYGYNTNEPAQPNYNPISPNHPQSSFLPGDWAWPCKDPNVRVTGNGGGKWFNFWAHGRQALRQETPFLRVEGTSNTLRIYHMHIQQQDSRNHAEFINSSNISVFGVKGEIKGALVLFKGCNNVRLFGSGGLTSPDPNYFAPHLFRFENCNNFLIAGINDTINTGGSQWIGGEFDRWIHANLFTWFPIHDSHPLREDVTVPSLQRPSVYLRGNPTGENTGPVPLSVSINAPATGQTVFQGAEVVFTASAIDQAEGDVSAFAEWTSSLDGVLGYGPTLTTRSLSPGTHTVGFTAESSSGFYARAEIQITVIAAGTVLTHNLAPEADTYVRGSSEANLNFGGDSTLRARGVENSQVLLRFNTSGLLGTPTAAMLRLHLNANDSGDASFHRISNDTWDEMAVTFNTRPLPGTSLGVLTAPGNQTTPLDLDVTSWVLERLPGGKVSVGATTGGSALVRFHSRESTDPARHPRLIVTTTTPTGPLAATVAITSPFTRSDFTAGEMIHFTATAVDPLDGDISSSGSWSSSITGLLGTGASVFTASLSPGTHVISYSVTNHSGLAGTAQVLVHVTGTAPDGFTAWATQYGVANDPMLDSMNDGMPNLMRYALGGTPATPASALNPIAEFSGSQFEFRFQRIADPALTYQVWGSNDLTDWGNSPIWSSTGTENTAGQVTVSEPATHTRRFLHLKVRRE